MRIAKDTLIVFSGDFVVGLTALTLNIIISRTLDVSGFGLFATAISVLLIASSVADFGLGTSLVRFTGLYRQKNRDLAESLTAVAFRLMIIAGAVVAAIVFLSAAPLSRYLSSDTNLTQLIRLAALGIFGTAVTATVLSILQANESFKRFAAINIFTAIARITLIAVLLMSHMLNTFSAVLVLSLAPILASVFGLISIRSRIPLRPTLRLPKKIISDYLHFGKWVIISFLAVSLMTRVDILLLAHFKNARAVGLYAAALQLSMVVYTFIGSMVRVVLPKVSKLTHKEQYVSFIKKSLAFSITACLLLSPILFFSTDIFLTVYGSKYLGSLGQFRLLFFTFLIFPLFQPVTFVVYALGRPFVMTFAHLAQFVISVISNLILIPIYGGYGAAITWLVINLFGTAFMVGYILFTVHRSSEIILKGEYQYGVQQESFLG